MSLSSLFTSFFSSALDPFTATVAFVLARAHHLLVAAGADPAAGATWLAAIVALVVTVRLVLLPVVVRQIRLAHAGARATPQITEIRRRYAGRTDLEGLRRQNAELRAVRSEHGIGATAMVPMLVQVPILLALFHVLRDVGSGVAVGAMGAALVASAGAAPLFGVAGAHLGSTLIRVGMSPSGLLIAVLALAAAAVTYASTRFLVLANTPTQTLEGAGANLQQTMQQALPTLSAVGLLAGAAVVPLGVILYWLVGALWTAGQQAAVNRWAPTPGSPAADRANGSRPAEG